MSQAVQAADFAAARPCDRSTTERTASRASRRITCPACCSSSIRRHNPSQPFRNEAASASPESVNANAFDAWLFKLKPANADDVNGLMNADAYKASVGA